MNSWLFMSHFGLKSNTTLLILLLKLFQLYPMEALSVSSCIPFIHAHQIFSTFLLRGTTRCSTIIIYISIPSPKISHLIRIHVSFYCKNVLEIKIMAVGVLITIGILLLPGTLSQKIRAI